jgi:hypothetical protein
LAAAAAIHPEQVINFIREAVVPRAYFDDSHFTQQKLKIMENLAVRYSHVHWPKMIDATHAENGVWEGLKRRRRIRSADSLCARRIRERSEPGAILEATARLFSKRIAPNSGSGFAEGRDAGQIYLHH